MAMLSTTSRDSTTPHIPVFLRFRSGSVEGLTVVREVQLHRVERLFLYLFFILNTSSIYFSYSFNILNAE